MAIVANGFGPDPQIGCTKAQENEFDRSEEEYRYTTRRAIQACLGGHITSVEVWAQGKLQRYSAADLFEEMTQETKTVNNDRLALLLCFATDLDAASEAELLKQELVDALADETAKHLIQRDFDEAFYRKVSEGRAA